jgi:hypothetical protein
MAMDWETIEHAPRGDGHPRRDALATWAVESGFRDARRPDLWKWPPRALWLMIALREPDTARLHDRAAMLPPGWLHVPLHYARPPGWLAGACHCTGIASPAFIEFLITGDAVDADGRAPDEATRQALTAIRAGIEAFEIGLQASAPWPDPAAPAAPAIEAGRARPAAGDPPGPLAPAGDAAPPPTVVAVIDDGLPFAHERFCWRDAGGRRRTRFLALWDQSCRATDPAWCAGRVLDAAAMDGAIEAATHHGRVDEDAAYHHAGVASLLRHRVTHGAHVLDLACGAALPAPVEAPAGPAIVGVQLMPMSSTLCLSPGAQLLDAIRFAVLEADRAHGGAPGCRVVVNASVGDFAGPHDTTSLFEAALDELVRLRRDAAADHPLDVVLPEGNAYLSRCHAWAELAGGTEFELDWHLRPDDGTSSYLEIWLRPAGFDPEAEPQDLAIALTLTPPAPLDPVTVECRRVDGARDGAREAVLRDGDDVIAVVGLHPEPANGRHWLGLLTVAPTVPEGAWHRCAPAGRWTLAIASLPGSATVYCNVYAQRDDKSFGFRGRGRQGVIEDGFNRVYDERGDYRLVDDDSYVRRTGTINGMANGHEVEVVGALVARAGGGVTPARYSAVSIPLEPAVLDRRQLAITEDSLVLHGILAAGSRSGSVVAMSGTSMAAPQRARELAEREPNRGQRRTSDFNGQERAIVEPAADLAARSRRRRGRA